MTVKLLKNMIVFVGEIRVKHSQINKQAAVAMIGINSGGGIVNHIDIAGPRAGIVMGCTNTAGTLAGILPPLISGWVLDDDDSDAKRWQTIFFIAAGVQMFACVVYGVFGSGKRQF